MRDGNGLKVMIVNAREQGMLLIDVYIYIHDYN